MPELPEVELYARYFAKHALRQPVARVNVLDERILGDIRPEAFKRRLKRREFTDVHRHGKHLFARAGEDLWLHLHFGMTGDLAYYSDASEAPRFARVVFDFENGKHLAYEDMRLFGVVGLAGSPDAFIDAHHLGPDPLDSKFTLAQFRRIAAKRRGAIKAVLMSQEIIAGIGNLYADEILYESGIHPRRSMEDVTAAEAKSVHTTMRRILRATIVRKARGADYPPKSLILHREEGDRCPRCGGEIGRTVVFGRTTYFCAKHQV
ncbi:MAG: DNA-formamidopyrimidine glycosylase family protein [Acidobacteriota bacterium]